MLINLRNAMMAGKRLPYDAEVEYLETDGSAYINTGAKIYNDTSVVVVWYSNYSTSTASYFFGSDNSTDRFYFREYNGNASYSTGSWWQNTNISTVGTHTIEMSNNGISVDGTASSRTGAAKTGDGNFCLFKVAAGNSPSGMRCYSCKIYQNGVLVRDFIPVRKGTVGYLYDRVSGKLFGNAGTGDFVVGSDVVPVEYIESHGTEYIDTGVTSGPSNLEFTIDCTITNTIGTSETYWTGSGVNSIGGLHYVLEQLGIRTGGGTVTNSIPYTSGERVQIRTYYDEQNRRNVQIGDRYYYGSAYSAPTGNLCLLRMVKLANQRGLFFGATVSQGGDFVRKFRPVRVGTEGATMDVLTRRIYRNAGTGAFTYGNDLKYPIPAA